MISGCRIGKRSAHLAAPRACILIWLWIAASGFALGPQSVPPAAEPVPAATGQPPSETPISSSELRDSDPGVDSGTPLELSAEAPPTAGEESPSSVGDSQQAVDPTTGAGVDVVSPPGSPPASEATIAEKPKTVGEQWLDRVDKLAEKIRDRLAAPEVADKLYPQLLAVLNSTSQNLDQAMRERSDEIQVLYPDMVRLYIARLRLIEVMSPLERAEIRGLDARGIAEFQGELLHIERHTRYLLETTRGRAREILVEYVASPMAGLRALVWLVVAIFLFRWSRRNGAAGLRKWRQRLVAARPRRRTNIQLAKLLWYLERVRAPLEWLLLMQVVQILLVSEKADFIQLLWVVGKWILVGWFAVLWIDAVASRGAMRISRDSKELRLRSLRLIAGWVVARGLALELVARYTGQGTVYTWIAFFSLAAMVPILVLLVIWWREEIFARLAERKDLPDFIERLQNRRQGISGFLGAGIAGGYLLVRGLLRRVLRLLSNFELGRRTLAYFFRREVARQSERQRELAKGRPLSMEIARLLLQSDSEVLDGVWRTELQKLLTLTRSVTQGTAAVIGERGTGKTRLLERLKERLGDAMLLVDCPPGSWEDLMREMGRGLGLRPEEATDEEILCRKLQDAAVEIIAVDNFHRLAVPAVGGLDQISRTVRFEARLGARMSWILAFDSAAWQYIRRLRSDILLAHQIVKLGPWTEGQISQLIETRNQAAGIDPNFDQLILPAHLNETDFDGEESTQAGFYRIIWDSARGNPEVAIRLWLESLVVLEDGRIAVRLFPSPAYDEIDRLDPLMLFGLRAVFRLETATPQEILDSLHVSKDQVNEILRSALNMGLIEETDGRYSIPWRWYRPISTVLRRQNLMKI